MSATIDAGGTGDGAAAPDDRAAPPATRGSRREQVALAVFVVLEVVAFPLIVWGPGRDQWFRFADDWDFLAMRDSLQVSDLFAPHNGHWTTVPLLVYRAIYRVVGLDYGPYLVVLVVLHLVTVALVRAVMRRCGVGPWIATVAASVLILFGPGSDDIVWAFQITFTGALCFGLTQLLLADHDGGVERRDWLALAAGAVALMCSGAGVVMVLVVGVALLLRRGWKMAALQTVPLGAVYATWYLWHRTTIEAQTRQYRNGPYGPGELVAFVWSGVRSSFVALGANPAVGVLLAVLLVGGLAVAWLPLDGATFRRQAALPLALLVGAVVFLAVTGQQRAFYGAEHAAESRYLYLLAVFVLPALAVAAQAIAARWRWAGPVVVVLLLLGVPRNATTVGDANPSLTPSTVDRERSVLLAAPRSPLAADAPGWLAPEPSLAPGVTMAWLRGAEAAGELPEPRALDADDEAQLGVRLGVAQISGARLLGADITDCRTVAEPTDLAPVPGTVVRGAVPIDVAPLVDGRPSAPAVRFRPIGTSTALQVVRADQHLRVTSTGNQPFEVCG